MTKIFDYAREIYDKDEQKRLLALEDLNPDFNLSDISAGFAKNHFQIVLNHRWKILKELFSEDDQYILLGRQKIISNFIGWLLTAVSRSNDGWLVETFNWFQKTFS